MDNHFKRTQKQDQHKIWPQIRLLLKAQPNPEQPYFSQFSGKTYLEMYNQ